jgi:abhydrolase domain-containing protein 13
MPRTNFVVSSISYRGYGLSEGKPSESGLQLDAQAALDYLHHDRTDIDR